jgi:hypothetical protein
VKRVTDVRKVLAEITAWEVRVLAVRRDHGEKISPTMKVAVATSMCPIAVQEAIFQGLGKFDDYALFKTKLRVMVENKISILDDQGNVPMDIARSKNEEQWNSYGDEFFEYGYDGSDQGECGLNYLGNGKGKGKGKLSMRRDGAF